MSYTRQEIYEEMKHRSYADAEDYRRTCENHGHFMSERVRWSDDVRDGCGYSRVGDEAVRAESELRYQERRREEQAEEEERERREESDRARRYQEDMQWEDNMEEA